MSEKKTKSSLLAKYLNLYERDSSSRVFAPLAQSYRKLGMLDEAFKVLKEGISKHPTYALGYVILGNCYYDKEDYDSCYQTLRPFVADNRDNLILLKIFANCCVKIGNLQEALESYKYLLLSNPRDIEAQEKIKLLEDDLCIEEETVHLPKYDNDFSSDEDDWVHVSFSEEKAESEQDSEWALLESKKEEEDPVVTLTLVDLYLAQGHLDKAEDLLDKFEQLHPNSTDIKLKRKHIYKIKEDSASPGERGPTSEEESHDRLLNIIDKKVKNNGNKAEILQKKLEYFLDLINEKSSQFS
jgi:tetratricopeptide (TPR) repeat protein